ncbi:hypothetical protein PPL_03533 [Heterostelium album PN500]|uniref:GRIP domain-containing protein n=1 Tax=Heterostelium pallidum (strain ATCC 26659 / Pp 5 / PN500) TaxID=670386 RepID=D3B523_HETP5|nr:hypothetical protein PPL_03533 [Heterostelium album PN500]EFA83491.1 hypothetical protein PPL_03533 [Heterostelium album PN500]|eukprot:XP_020435608.1 hypothetical protein PPL_03533 [Heterostelium album PN500]
MSNSQNNNNNNNNNNGSNHQGGGWFSSFSEQINQIKDVITNDSQDQYYDDDNINGDDDIEDQILMLRAEVNKYKLENEELEKRSLESEQRMASVTKEFSRLMSEKETELTDLRNINTNLKQTLMSPTTTTATATTTTTDSPQQHTIHNDLNGHSSLGLTLENENQMVFDDDNTNNNENDTLQSLQIKLKKQSENYQSQISTLQQLHQDKIYKLNHQIETLQQEIEHINEMNQTNNEQNDTLKKENDQLKEDIAKVNVILTEKEEKEKESEKQDINSNDNIDNSQLKKEIEQLNEELTKLRAEKVVGVDNNNNNSSDKQQELDIGTRAVPSRPGVDHTDGAGFRTPKDKRLTGRDCKTPERETRVRSIESQLPRGKRHHQADAADSQHQGEGISLSDMCLQEQESVDKRIVSKLFLTYFNVKGTKKLDVLELIAKILSFNDDEKVTIGLTKRQWSLIPFFGNGTTPTAEQNGEKSLTDMWIEFLLKEAETNNNNMNMNGGSDILMSQPTTPSTTPFSTPTKQQQHLMAPPPSPSTPYKQQQQQQPINNNYFSVTPNPNGKLKSTVIYDGDIKNNL